MAWVQKRSDASQKTSVKTGILYVVVDAEGQPSSEAVAATLAAC